MKAEVMMLGALLLLGCDKAKVKVNVEATGDNISVDGKKTGQAILKKDETGTTVNGQPVDAINVTFHKGQLDVKTTPPPSALVSAPAPAAAPH